MDVIALDEGDVTIERLDRIGCDCEMGPETHRVMLDLRANGRLAEVFRGCEVCAQEFAIALQSSLRVPGGGASRL